MESTYVIGIDLGTTNSALAFAPIRADTDPLAPANVQVMAIPQLVNPGEGARGGGPQPVMLLSGAQGRKVIRL